MLAQKLKQLRADKGISQAVLAEAMEVTQGTVGKWETARRIPDAETLRRLSRYFEVPIDYLLNDGTDEDDEVILLYRRLHRLPKEVVKTLIDETIDSYLKALDQEENS